MKPSRLIYILFLPLLALSSNARAQTLQSVIQVQNLTGVNDTATYYLDSTYTVEFDVVNTEPNGIYTGPLAVLYSNNDNGNLPGILTVAETNITIPNQQPVHFVRDITFYSDYFVLGGGITTVVVWPQVQSPTGEPYIIQIHLVDALTIGIDDKPNQLGDIKLYPNPASDRLIVGANGLKSSLERVRIFNLAGQLVLDVANPSDTEQHLTLDLSTISNGVYILEAVTPKGSIRKKFVKL
jgi:hypothetical protein